MAAPINTNLFFCSRRLDLCRLLAKQASKCRYASNKSVKKKNKFIDSLRIYVRGGAGGQGFPRYGGVGGDGGNVIVTSSRDVRLSGVRDKQPNKRFIAPSGSNSRKFRLLANPGEDLNINVPVGVVLRTDNGRLLGDLDLDEQKLVLVKGGKGGNPDNGFLGQRGASREINLDLKLIADVGLVGFPNAGKSTFLSSVSRAKPKIAEYPFTTIRPQIGIIEYSDFRQISVADLPGLIEGAHINYGMGHKFLKHIERTKLLLMIVDINGFRLGVHHQHRTAFETILLLNKELELYLPELVTRPTILVLNKIDTVADNDQKLQQILQQVENLPESLETVTEELQPQTLLKFDAIFSISAQKKMRLEDVTNKVRERLDYYAEVKASAMKEKEAIVEETVIRRLI